MRSWRTHLKMIYADNKWYTRTKNECERSRWCIYSLDKTTTKNNGNDICGGKRWNRGLNMVLTSSFFYLYMFLLKQIYIALCLLSSADANFMYNILLFSLIMRHIINDQWYYHHWQIVSSRNELFFMVEIGIYFFLL